MKALSDFLSRAPFVLLGVLGIFSVVGTFLSLEENIALTLEAWRAVTRPIWDFLLGWAFELFSYDVPWWLKDYLTVGLVTCSMVFRRLTTSIRDAWRLSIGFEVFDKSKSREYVSRVLIRNAHRFLLNMLLLWPWIWFKNLYRSKARIEKMDKREIEADRKQRFIFIETLVYALILISVNYVLIEAFSQPARPPEIEIWV